MPNQLIIPLDHKDVVRPRPGGFLYGSILELLDNHLDEMTAAVQQLRPRLERWSFLLDPEAARRRNALKVIMMAADEYGVMPRIVTKTYGIS